MSVTITQQFTQEEFEHRINEVGIENVVNLYINYSNIYKIPYFPNLKELSCSFSNISSIPSMKKLDSLWCYGCPNLSEIFHCPNLRQLDCSYSNVSLINSMENLVWLLCDNCPNLLEIPYLPNLKFLKCDINLKMKFYTKILIVINHEKAVTIQHLQGRLYQNTYRTYELLIF